MSESKFHLLKKDISETFSDLKKTYSAAFLLFIVLSIAGSTIVYSAKNLTLKKVLPQIKDFKDKDEYWLAIIDAANKDDSIIDVLMDFLNPNSPITNDEVHIEFDRRINGSFSGSSVEFVQGAFARYGYNNEIIKDLLNDLLIDSKDVEIRLITISKDYDIDPVSIGKINDLLKIIKEKIPEFPTSVDFIKFNPYSPMQQRVMKYASYNDKGMLLRRYHIYDPLSTNVNLKIEVSNNVVVVDKIIVDKDDPIYVSVVQIIEIIDQSAGVNEP